jgi:hypothetical protein
MSVSFAQGVYDLPNLYKKANDHFMLGEYRQAVEVYDEIFYTNLVDQTLPAQMKHSL